MLQHLVPLTRAKRILIGAAALGCYAAAIVLAPSGVRSQLDAGPRSATGEPAPHAQAPVAQVAPRGDAFAPRSALEDDRPPGAAPPLTVTLAHPIGILPPQPALAPGTRVTAIATGALPTAIVESGGTAHVMTVGDPLEGSRITSIDGATVELANGRHLSLEPAAPAP